MEMKKNIILIISPFVFLCAFFGVHVSMVNGEGNNAPSIATTYISSISNAEVASENPITPSPGTTKTVYVYGNASDVDGDTDITSVFISFYRTGITSASCDEPSEADPNQCYQANCTLDYGDPDTATRYDCTIALDYYADATIGGGPYGTDDWSVLVTAEDAATATGDNSGFLTTTEIDEISAANIQSSFSWGQLDLGHITTAQTNAVMTITQEGNSVLDINISGTDMTCESGVIEMNRISYTFTDSDGGTPLTASPVNIFDFNLPLRTDAPVTKDIFWNLGLPETGIGGVCTGSTVITTEAG